MSLALNEQKLAALYSNLTSMKHKWEEIIDIVCKQQIGNHKGPTSNKNSR